MNGQIPGDSTDLARKIARLVEERGWNQEDFARISGLNRQTVRTIMLGGDPARRLRNVTVLKCATALGLTVNDLRTVPLDRLLQGPVSRSELETEGERSRLYDQATQPELRAWIERNPERALQLTEEELDGLLSLQGTGGHLTRFGVEHYVAQFERKRQLLERIHAVAGTEYVDLLEQIVALLYEKVQPYADRK